MIFPERRNVKQVDFRRTSHIVPQNFTYETEVDSTVAGHPSYRRKRGGEQQPLDIGQQHSQLVRCYMQMRGQFIQNNIAWPGC